MAAICGASLGSARRSRGVERWDNSILCFQVISNQCISSQSSTAITDPDSNAGFAPSSETPGGYVGQAGNEHRSPLIPGRRVFPNAVAAVDYRRRHPGELQRGMQRPSVPLTSHLSPLTSHLSPLTSHLSLLTSHVSRLTRRHHPAGALPERGSLRPIRE